LIADRVFYGWWVVLLGSLILAVGSGILYHGFTVFFLPLKRDLAVSSAAVSLLYGAARLEGGAEGPLVGYLIDRFGPRVLIAGGAILCGLGLILLSTVNSFTGFFIIYIFIVSLGYNAGFFHPVYAAVNSWFVRHRGVGFSITSASASIGGMVMAPLLSYLIFTSKRNGTISMLAIAWHGQRRIGKGSGHSRYVETQHGGEKIPQAHDLPAEMDDWLSRVDLRKVNPRSQIPKSGRKARKERPRTRLFPLGRG
jgi:MFS family permease